MTKYRQNIFDSVLSLGSAKPADIRKWIKRIAKLNEDYENGCTAAMNEYLHIFTAVHTQESLDNRGIVISKMLKLAKEYESTKGVPKPRREIVDRKTAKARARAKTAANSKKRKRGKKV